MLGYADPSKVSFTKEELAHNPVPSGVDPANRELYLSDEEFKTVFKMNKAEMKALPAWKRQGLKKAQGLF